MKAIPRAGFAAVLCISRPGAGHGNQRLTDTQRLPRRAQRPPTAPRPTRGRPGPGPGPAPAARGRGRAARLQGEVLFRPTQGLSESLQRNPAPAGWRAEGLPAGQEPGRRGIAAGNGAGRGGMPCDLRKFFFFISGTSAIRLLLSMLLRYDRFLKGTEHPSLPL